MTEQEKQNEAAYEIKKCKRTQFSIPTFTIIFYVFSKTSNILLPASNDRSVELLNHLFGADKYKLEQNLSRLSKLSHLSPKEKAEIQKGLTNARAFFEKLQHPPAKQILGHLDLKMVRS